MQIDMHYYGVYAMARAAGLTREASGRIATASELVDDNAEEEHVEFGDGGRLDLMPTAHHTLDTENRNEEMQRKVWVPFHFIPGNRGRTVAERLVCRKDSAIAREVVDHAVRMANRAFGPQLIGITAHVYADTFSHYGFSGASCVRSTGWIRDKAGRSMTTRRLSRREGAATSSPAEVMWSMTTVATGGPI